jgi:hypothetical protein
MGEPWYEEGLPGQIPAPSAIELPEDKHDDAASYGEHPPQHVAGEEKSGIYPDWLEMDGGATSKDRG